MEGLEPASFLEITSIPALNLEQRLGYLIRYPHGCGEQITSAVFPQLMLDRIMDLSEAQKVTAELHVKDVITRLRQLPSKQWWVQLLVELQLRFRLGFHLHHGFLNSSRESRLSNPDFHEKLRS